MTNDELRQHVRATLNTTAAIHFEIIVTATLNRMLERTPTPETFTWVESLMKGAR